MRSNVTVGPPIDLLLYRKDSMKISQYRRLNFSDADLNYIHSAWEQALRRVVEQLPEIHFGDGVPSSDAPEKDAQSAELGSGATVHKSD